jgi:hypothetical protein
MADDDDVSVERRITFTIRVPGRPKVVQPGFERGADLCHRIYVAKVVKREDLVVLGKNWVLGKVQAEVLEIQEVGTRRGHAGGSIQAVD